MSGASRRSWRQRYHAEGHAQESDSRDLGGDSPGFELVRRHGGHRDERPRGHRAAGEAPRPRQAPSFARREGTTLSTRHRAHRKARPLRLLRSQRASRTCVSRRSTLEDELMVHLPAGFKGKSVPEATAGESPFGAYAIDAEASREQGHRQAPSSCSSPRASPPPNTRLAFVLRSGRSSLFSAPRPRSGEVSAWRTGGTDSRPRWRLLVGLAVSCGGARPSAVAPDVEAARAAGQQSNDGEVVGRWLLVSSFPPADRPVRPRRRARGWNRCRMPACSHRWRGPSTTARTGAPQRGVRLRRRGQGRARSSADPRAPLVAWFSTNHLLSLAPNATGLWGKARARAWRTRSLHPGGIGWRARGELVDWWSARGVRLGQERRAPTPRPRSTAASATSGSRARSATARRRDRRRAFDAERPARGRSVAARRAASTCPAPAQDRAARLPRADAPKRCTGAGVFYAETFVDLPADRDVVVAVQGAYRVSVDDVVVLERDTRVWAYGPSSACAMRLAAGRHRILARVGGAENRDPLARPRRRRRSPSTSSSDPRPVYGLSRPPVLAIPMCSIAS